METKPRKVGGLIKLIVNSSNKNNKSTKARDITGRNIYLANIYMDDYSKDKMGKTFRELITFREKAEMGAE